MPSSVAAIAALTQPGRHGLVAAVLDPGQESNIITWFDLTKLTRHYMSKYACSRCIMMHSDKWVNDKATSLGYSSAVALQRVASASLTWWISQAFSWANRWRCGCLAAQPVTVNQRVIVSSRPNSIWCFGTRRGCVYVHMCARVCGCH